MILMLLWEIKETTKYVVLVHADGAEHCFVSFGSDTVSTWMFWMEEPSTFHTVYKSVDFVSVILAGKSPPCRECVYGAGRNGWKESAGWNTGQMKKNFK